MDLTAVATAIADAYEPARTGYPCRIGQVDTIQTFLEAVEAGNYLQTAADLADISQETIRLWMKRGEAGEEPFKLFLGAVKRATARAEAQEVQKVRAAGNDPRFWAASMTYLERRHPEKWGRRNESQDSPKIIVQIGVQATDVQVSVLTSTPSPTLDTASDLRLPVTVDSMEGESHANQDLSPDPCLIKTHSVNPASDHPQPSAGRTVLPPPRRSGLVSPRGVSGGETKSRRLARKEKKDTV